MWELADQGSVNQASRREGEIKRKIKKYSGNGVNFLEGDEPGQC